MRYRVVICIAFAMLVSSCASTNTVVVPTADDGRVIVTDLRTAKQKAHRRDSIFSPIMYLGDDEVKPSAVLLLKSALQRQAQVAGKLSLEISELRVIYYFPARLRANPVVQGGIGEDIMNTLVDSNTDSAFIGHLDVPDFENSVICVVVGKLNGRPVKTAMHRAYRESVFTFLIRNDPHFKEAIAMSLDACAADLVSQMSKR